MKTIKKILSIIMSVVMISTLAFTAFAANNENRPLESVTATVKSGKNAEITVKTEKEGIYYLELYSQRDAILVVDVFDGENHLFGRVMTASGDNIREINDSYFFKADADRELTVSLFNIDLLDPDKDDFSVRVTPVYCGNNELAVGENKAESEISVFSFIPEQDGYYSFESDAPKTVNPRIIVSDTVIYPEINDDNGLEDDNNFSLTVFLRKGEKYIVGVTSAENADNEFTPFSFTVSLNKKFDIKSVALDYHENGETIKTYRGHDYVTLVSLTPTGALYDPSEITVSVSNEKVASFDVDSRGFVTIHPHRLGKTTLTITSANGCEAQYTIKVRPYIFWLFSRFCNFVSSLFEN